MQDSQIVKLFWDRNEEAIAQARDVYASYCTYIAQNLLHDPLDTEECLNDVLLSAWNSIPPQKPSNLKTYLGKLTRENAVDRLRKKTAQKRFSGIPAASLDELEEIIGENTVEAAITEKELSHLISVFLRSAREDERNIFIRRYWFYDSVKSISDRYGMGQSKVLVTLKRTRDKLAQYLKTEGYIV